MISLDCSGYVLMVLLISNGFLDVFGWSLKSDTQIRDSDMLVNQDLISIWVFDHYRGRAGRFGFSLNSECYPLPL